jgi:hypothetical protein
MGVIPFRNFIPEPLEHATDPTRPHLLSSVLYPLVGEYRPQLTEFAQIDLLGEDRFLDWLKSRSVPVFGSTFGSDLQEFWSRGWLRADKADIVKRGRRRPLVEPVEALSFEHPLGEKIRGAGRGRSYELQFHPFRLYPMLRILSAMRWTLSRGSVLYPKGLREHADRHVQRVRTHLRSPRFLEQIEGWNGIADLAILLEPLYWPYMTGRTTERSFVLPGSLEETNKGGRLAEYRSSILAFVQRIPKAMLAGAHMDLRYQASLLDDNQELYLILRASSWSRRERLKGDIGAALWIRHLAEVIRLAYDELYDDRLVHEDEAGSQWVEGARAWVYGSEYPLENPREMIRRVLPRYGIDSSPRVRFYVEGDTEEGAMEEALQGYLGYGIEIVNLKSRGWDDWLLLQLQKDVEASRLSLIMLDGDRKDHIEAIRRRATEGRIVGMVFLNTPDIELGNFSIEQLVRATQLYETELGLEGPPLDVAAFEGVASGRSFAKTYEDLRLSRGIKGAAWGRALVKVAYEDREHDGDETNGLVYAVACAHRAMTTDYDASKRMYRINLITLKTEPTGECAF